MAPGLGVQAIEVPERAIPECAVPELVVPELVTPSSWTRSLRNRSRDQPDKYLRIARIRCKCQKDNYYTRSPHFSRNPTLRSTTITRSQLLLICVRECALDLRPCFESFVLIPLDIRIYRFEAEPSRKIQLFRNEWSSIEKLTHFF